MLERLWSALAARVAAQLALPDPELVEQLRERLTALEQLQTGREIEWADTRERLLKYLRRVEGRAARDKQLADAQDPMASARATALALKFPNRAGG
jgi:lipoate-protein ligase A